MKHHVTLTFEIPSAISQNAAIAAAKLVCCSRRGVHEFLIKTEAVAVESSSPPPTKTKAQPPPWRKRTKP